MLALVLNAKYPLCLLASGAFGVLWLMMNHDCPVSECKMWRNPLNLFRGAEYQRFQAARNREPLTYYDMNLSAQDHQTFFTCDADAGKPEYESE